MGVEGPLCALLSQKLCSFHRVSLHMHAHSTSHKANTPFVPTRSQQLEETLQMHYFLTLKPLRCIDHDACHLQRKKSKTKED